MPRSKTLLLVDDNQEDTELALSVLQKSKIAGTVVTLRDGEEALEYLHRRGSFAKRAPEDPVAIFLDLKMPRVNGLEVLRQVKTNEKLKVIPIVMLTSSSQESDVVKSYQLGANAYVVKPVDFKKFGDSIRQLGHFWTVLNEPAVLAR